MLSGECMSHAAWVHECRRSVTLKTRPANGASVTHARARALPLFLSHSISTSLSLHIDNSSINESLEQGQNQSWELRLQAQPHKPYLAGNSLASGLPPPPPRCHAIQAGTIMLSMPSSEARICIWMSAHSAQILLTDQAALFWQLTSCKFRCSRL